MVLRGIPSHDQNDIRVGDVGPAVRHGPAAERGGQTGHRWAVSKPGLIFVGDDAQPETKLAKEVVDLVRVGAAADDGGVGKTIDGPALPVLFLETRVSRRLDQTGHAVQRFVPGNDFPFTRAGGAVQRPRQTPIVYHKLPERDSFRAKRSAVDGIIRISFDVHNGWRDIAGLVSKSVDDHTACDRAVRTNAVGFGGPGDLELASLGKSGRNVEAKSGGHRPAAQCALDEASSRKLHGL